MARNERGTSLQPRSPGAACRFMRWEVAGSDPGRSHIISTLDPVTVSFMVDVGRHVSDGQHGVALFNADRQLIWARAEQNLRLDPGVHTFSHTFPSLPLRPGPYQWQVSFWDSGEMLDLWDCIPELVIATESHQHFMDQWNGILNLPSQFQHQLREEINVERTMDL